MNRLTESLLITRAGRPPSRAQSWVSAVATAGKSFHRSAKNNAAGVAWFGGSRHSDAGSRFGWVRYVVVAVTRGDTEDAAAWTSRASESVYSSPGTLRW